MTALINQPIVLVLNRHWQAVHVCAPSHAFCQMVSSAATALDIARDGAIRPVSWQEWFELPVRAGDHSVRTSRGLVRIPAVLVAVNYARVPKRRVKLCARTIRQRDGNRCQYTGRLLQPEEGNLDHVIPRSRGGADTWENLVWSAKEVNHRKGDKLPHEAGLTLLSKPRAPRELPASAFLKNDHRIPEWNLFLIE